MARKEPRDLTIKRLYALSGNQCAFPGCSVKFFSSKSEMNISNVCHIEAAEDGGERYNPDSNDEYRRSFENLILLCPNHHNETNDVKKYTVEILRKMKSTHEDKIQNLVKLQRNPSALNFVIQYIGVNLLNHTQTEPQNAPNPQNKIQYNNVIRYKYIIKDYAIYQGKLNNLYKEIENQGSLKKELVLRNIKNLYLQEKGKYNTFEEIKQNADNIIDKIKDDLWNIIDDSSNSITDLDIESIESSLLIVLVDAFMRCNILEEPPKL